MLACCKRSGNNQSGGGNDAQIPSDLFAFECLLESSDKEKIIEVEVNAEKQHKNCDNHFGIKAVVAFDAVVEYAETARTCSCKGINEAVKKGIPPARRRITWIMLIPQ